MAPPPPPPSPETISQLKDLLEQAILMDGQQQLSIHYKAWHKGYPEATIERFLKARENNVSKAFKMLMDSLQWRVENNIDNILSRPIGPKETFDAIRESQPLGMTGFCKKIDMYVQSHIQINEYRDQVLLALTIISTIDDLNYPEKTDVYYIVNTPYIFSACWKVVRPLLHERTRRKVQVLQGSGKEELLKVMDSSVIPHFCKYDTRTGKTPIEMGLVDCFSPSHQFHQDVWNYIKQQCYASKCVGPSPQRSLHIELLEREEHDKSIQTSIKKSSLVDLAHCDEGCSEHASSGVSNLLLEDFATTLSVTTSYVMDD